jgi:hypothetical protein
MPHTEKQEREKLQAAMATYRVLVYLTVICVIALLPLFPAIFSRPIMIALTLMQLLLITTALTWHFISLRKTYLTSPYNFQSRPKIIAILIVMAICMQIWWLAIISATTIDIGDLDKAGYIVTMGMPRWIRAFPQYFSLLFVFHLAALIVAIVMFVLFHQFRVIYRSREIANRTNALLDSDPLGIADELRKLKTSRPSS